MVTSIAIKQSQFNISHFFCTIFSICPRDRILSVATSPGQNGPRSNGNEGVCYILQISKIEASPSDVLLSYLRHSLVGETQLVYSTAPADWATGKNGEKEVT